MSTKKGRFLSESTLFILLTTKRIRHKLDAPSGDRRAPGQAIQSRRPTVASFSRKRTEQTARNVPTHPQQPE